MSIDRRAFILGAAGSLLTLIGCDQQTPTSSPPQQPAKRNNNLALLGKEYVRKSENGEPTLYEKRGEIMNGPFTLRDVTTDIIPLTPNTAVWREEGWQRYTVGHLCGWEEEYFNKGRIIAPERERTLEAGMQQITLEENRYCALPHRKLLRSRGGETTYEETTLLVPEETIEIRENESPFSRDGSQKILLLKKTACKN